MAHCKPCIVSYNRLLDMATCKIDLNTAAFSFKFTALAASTSHNIDSHTCSDRTHARTRAHTHAQDIHALEKRRVADTVAAAENYSRAELLRKQDADKWPEALRAAMIPLQVRAVGDGVGEAYLFCSCEMLL